MIRFLKICPVLAVLLLLVGCSKELPVSPQDVSIPEVGRVEAGQIVLQFQDELEDTDIIKEKFPDLGIISVEPLFTSNPRFEERFRRSGLHLWYNVTFDKNVSMTKAHQDFSSIDGVQTVEYKPSIRPSQVLTTPFNDPKLGTQWHYYNDGKNDRFVAGADMNLLKAWPIETGSEDVIVAVLDEGIDYNHDDLKDAMWVNEAEKNGAVGVDDDGNGFVDDIYGLNFCTANGSTPKGSIVPGDHGTHVAGTVAATNNNGLFGAGVAGGNGKDKRGVRIMCSQMIEDNFPAFDGNALIYGADNGAVIAQNSWGYKDATATPNYFKEALDYFIQYAGCDENGNQIGPMKGGIVIFAAGNDNKTVSYPPMEENVLAVSSYGPDGTRAYYSNYGEWVDIAAPGGDQQKFSTGGGVYSTLLNNTYGALQGTSMACPHVSGVAALIVSKYGGPGFTPDKLREMLLNSADYDKLYDANPGYVGKLGKGALDAYEALYEEDPLAPDPVSDITSDVLSNSLNIKWTHKTYSDGVKPYAYNVYYSPMDLSSLDRDNLPEGVNKVNVVAGDVVGGNETISAPISDLKFGIKYYVRIEALNMSGVASELSPQVTLTTKGNNSPILSIEGGQTNYTLKSFEVVERSISVSDPDGHTVTLSLESEVSQIYLKEGDGGYTLVINAPMLDEGTYTANLVAKDSYDGVSSIVINVTILPNHAPVVSKQIPDMLINKSDKKDIKLSEYFTDEDGEALLYSVKVKGNVVKSSVAGDVLTLTGNWYGKDEVTVEAKDAKNQSASAKFVVVLRDTADDLDIYPVPMKDVLNIRTAEATTADISISNNSGAILYSVTGAEVSPFAPHTVDVSAWTPGQYVVSVKYNGKSINKNVVKL